MDVQMEFMIGNYFQVLASPESDQVMLKFQTALPSVAEPGKRPLETAAKIAKDMTIFITKKDAQELSRLLAEYAV